MWVRGPRHNNLPLSLTKESAGGDGGFTFQGEFIERKAGGGFRVVRVRVFGPLEEGGARARGGARMVHAVQADQPSSDAEAGPVGPAPTLHLRRQQRQRQQQQQQQEKRAGQTSTQGGGGKSIDCFSFVIVYQY